ncbi:MAG: hypothetical protein ACOX2X_01140 [Peptococcia bacterium]
MLQSCATATIGVVILAIVLQNVTFYGNRISVLERIVYLLAALALIDPGHATDILGLGFIILAYVIGLIWVMVREKKYR